VDSLRSATGYDLSSLRDEQQFFAACQIPDFHNPKLLTPHGATLVHSSDRSEKADFCYDHQGMSPASRSTDSVAPVLILGAGVNGICVARELIRNRIPVWIVDTSDIAFGATAKSSRLIHGGLRYLEYADFRLVAESLHERDRLLQLAPQFVVPLKLHIPIRRRTGGLIAAGLRFLGLSRTRLGRWIGLGGGRGLWTVRLGLWLYDLLARSQQVPRHQANRTGQGGPAFPSDRYPWSCSYYDARMEYPERFCIALLKEIEQVASISGTEFRLLTYHRARVVNERIEIGPVSPADLPGSTAPVSIQPSCIINATGAWGDWTLRDLPAVVPVLFGGTKGSHLFTSQPRLREAIGPDAIYAEATDGRLVFLIPMTGGVMIGTTDERFDERPELARSSDSEQEYLIQLTNELFPHVGLTADDIHSTCAGIRPLPNSGASRTASISRDHQIDERELLGVPLLTLIGGKLTTCRALGEQTADKVLQNLKQPRIASTRDRPIWGAQQHPPTSELAKSHVLLARKTGYTQATCAEVWSLVGTVAHEYLSESGSPLVSGTVLPRCVVSRIIEREWVTTLDDLIERRLMLALKPTLFRQTIQELAEMLSDRVGTGASVEEMVERTLRRLSEFYGRRNFDDRSVACATHGLQGMTLLCTHVAHAIDGGEPVGFYCDSNTDMARPDAWCHACEQARLAISADDSIDVWYRSCDFKILCAQCWDEARLRLGTPPTTGGSTH
jgi:glycerol-3-phosphate dehydrogenase